MKDEELITHPNLVIAGVNKAGTTSLFSYLSKHPEVSSSSIKETCYFLPIRYNEKLTPIEDYYSLFKYEESRKIYMEATPGYFYGGIELINKIDTTLPSTKIILILREPSSRLLSFYHFMKSMLLIDQNMTFMEYTRHCCSLNKDELKKRDNNPFFGVEGGYYNLYINDWIKVFGDRLKIIFFEDMKTNPVDTLTNLSLWLGIESNYYVDFKFNVENRTSNHKNKYLHKLAINLNRRLEIFFRLYPNIKNKLRNIYTGFNSNEFASISFEEQKIARSFYVDSNKELKKILKTNNLTPVPSWIENSK